MSLVNSVPLPKSPGRSITAFFPTSKPVKLPALTISDLQDLVTDEDNWLDTLESPMSTPNSTPKKRSTQTVIVKPSPSKRTKLKEDDDKQWRLDSGLKDTIHCNECDMLYSTVSENDRDAHRLFHRAKTGKFKITISATMEVVYTKPTNPSHQIVLLGKKDLAKEKIRNLLELVDRELQLGDHSDGSKENEKIFVFLVDKVGVGVIRVEKIENAFRLTETSIASELRTSEDDDLNADAVSISNVVSNSDKVDILRYSKRPEPAMLGISRIWIRSEFKRQGIASLLLDTARAHFSFGSVVPKAMCAMTQPTMEGRQFSMRYFGTRGYLVYETGSN